MVTPTHAEARSFDSSGTVVWARSVIPAREAANDTGSMSTSKNDVMPQAVQGAAHQTPAGRAVPGCVRETPWNPRPGAALSAA